MPNYLPKPLPPNTAERKEYESYDSPSQLDPEHVPLAERIAARSAKAKRLQFGEKSPAADGSSSASENMPAVAPGPLTPNGEWMFTPDGGRVRLNAVKVKPQPDGEQENSAPQENFPSRDPAKPLGYTYSPQTPFVAKEGEEAAEAAESEVSDTRLVSKVSGVGAFIEQQPPWVQAIARGLLCVCLPVEPLPAGGV